MKVTQIVFSPTGGTQRMADHITAEWEKPIDRVDLTDVEMDFSSLQFTQDDVVAIAVPSYGGRAPALAAERLTKINGNQLRCVLICVYGNRAYEDTLAELKDVAEHSDFHVIAAISAVAEHSIMHQYAISRPDQKDEDELHGRSSKK